MRNQHHTPLRWTLLALLAGQLLFAPVFRAAADGWQFWANVGLALPLTGSSGAQLANDGTNIYYSTILDGVYRAALADGNFSAMPLTGFPLWDANLNTNGLAVSAIAATPQGTIVIAGSPVQVTTNGVMFNPPGGAANSLPVFYWWDETNQLWHAAGITNKNYPYTGNVGNFSIAPDGALWTCSGFYPYVYRSLDGGRNYTAFDINARVPTNYFPLPFGNFTTFGEVFSVCAGWGNEVVIGTETGGFLHSTNSGLSWRSLDPDFTNTNSLNPLGRIGDARVAGWDHYGNFLCGNFLPVASPAQNLWSGVKLLGWNPRDGSVFAATNGLPGGYGVSLVLTPPAGVTYTFLNQSTNNLGGVYRSLNGRNWSQFNDNLPAVSPNVGNAQAAGNCFTVVSNTFYLGFGPGLYRFDSTPPPIANRPPVAQPQNLNLWQNVSTNLTLAGWDADGQALNFTILTEPQNGLLSGTPPDMSYTPTNGFTGLDFFAFVADDGAATSAPVVVNLAINAATNTLSTVAITYPTNGASFGSPTNLQLTATASDPDGIRTVNFYADNLIIGQVTNAPYALTLTNLSVGDHVFSARVIDRLGARTWSAPVRLRGLSALPRAVVRPVDHENVAVTWPLDVDGFFLESAPEPSGPWTLVPYPPLYFTNGQTVTMPAVEQQFFRLMAP